MKGSLLSEVHKKAKNLQNHLNAQSKKEDEVKRLIQKSAHESKTHRKRPAEQTCALIDKSTAEAHAHCFMDPVISYILKEQSRKRAQKRKKKQKSGNQGPPMNDTGAASAITGDASGFLSAFGSAPPVNQRNTPPLSQEALQAYNQQAHQGPLNDRGNLLERVRMNSTRITQEFFLKFRGT